MDTIRRERREIRLLHEDSPSLTAEVSRMITRQGPQAAKDAGASLSGHDEASAHLLPPSYTAEQVLGDWFPEAPKPAP
jgi:hypothetical protein